MERPASTISREVARNRCDAGGYEAIGPGSAARGHRRAGWSCCVRGRLCGRIVSRAKDVVAAIYNIRPTDLVFYGGEISGERLPAPLSLAEVSLLMERANSLPPHLRGALEGECDEIITEAAFSFGAPVCEVEIDPLTCVVPVDRYSAIDDVGRAINPMIIHGQTHGGVAQGVGQALS